MSTATGPSPDSPIAHTCGPFEVRAEDIQSEFSSLPEAEAAARLLNFYAARTNRDTSAWQTPVPMDTLAREVAADRAAITEWTKEEDGWRSENKAQDLWHKQCLWTLGLWRFYESMPGCRIRPQTPRLRLKLQQHYPEAEKVMLAFVALEERGYVTIDRSWGNSCKIAATPKLSDVLKRTVPLDDIISHTADAVLVFGEELPKAA